MNKENLKTLFLVLLFVASLFLTQRLWIILPLGEDISASNELNGTNIDISDVLSPQSFIVNFGGGNHTVFFSEPYEVWNITKTDEKEKIWIWKRVKGILKNHFSQDFQVEEITLEEWRNINKFKSIRMDFACRVPGEGLIKALNNEKKIVDKRVGYVNSILIPGIEAEKLNVYVADTNENIYLKLKGQHKYDGIRELIENVEKMIEIEKKQYITYYPLSDYIAVENEILTPIFDGVTIPRVKITNEINVSDKTQIKSLANIFFGDNFDFVKEIIETNGTIIYMYGYGERALKINEDGILEHIEKVDKRRINRNFSFIESLKIACNFIEEYMDWPVNSQNAYLVDYKEIEKDRKKGYVFCFSYRLNGLPVVVNNPQGNSIEIEVVGNQVTYYKRAVKRAGEKLNVKKEVPLIIEVLDKNLKFIKDNYVRDNNLNSLQVENSKILELIKGIELAYYEKQGELVPVWKITVDNTIYYFDLYEGTIRHVHKTNRGV